MLAMEEDDDLGDEVSGIAWPTKQGKMSDAKPSGGIMGQNDTPQLGNKEPKKLIEFDLVDDR